MDAFDVEGVWLCVVVDIERLDGEDIGGFVVFEV